MLGAKQGDPRVAHLLEQLGLTYEVDSDGDYRVGFVYKENGRGHVAFIRSETGNFGNFEIRDIFAYAGVFEGELDANIANAMLVLNARLKMGSWRILRGIDSGGRSALAFGAQIAANTDARSLMTTLNLVASSADEIERELTGEDNF